MCGGSSRVKTGPPVQNGRDIILIFYERSRVAAVWSRAVLAAPTRRVGGSSRQLLELAKVCEREAIAYIYSHESQPAGLRDRGASLMESHENT